MDLLCLFRQTVTISSDFEYSNDNLFTFLNNLGEKILCPIPSYQVLVSAVRRLILGPYYDKKDYTPTVKGPLLADQVVSEADCLKLACSSYL